MALKYVSYAVFGFALVNVCVAFQTGAPNGTCETMFPKHGVSAQTGPSPFTISTDKNTVKAGEKITVTIKGTKDATFKGFLLQARDSANNTLGSFGKVANSQLLSCKDGKDNAATHTDGEPKSSISIPWTAPSGLKPRKSFAFVATIVKDGGTFWVAQKSRSITVSA